MTPETLFIEILKENKPDAIAWIFGDENNPQMKGIVKFFYTHFDGVLIETELFELPNRAIPESSNFYAMHIHENGECTPTFEKAGGHYTRGKEKHPQHTGDLVPLMGNQGYAWGVFLDKRFTIDEIIGRSVIIHAMPDDFVTQPAGNSGAKIGCGVIEKVNRRMIW